MGNDRTQLERFRSIFTRVWPANGSRFQNYYSFRNSREGERLLQTYSGILLCDDDIDRNTLKAHLLFQVREDLTLSVLVPAFHPDGKISWSSDEYVPNSFLRFGTFLEMS